VRHQQDAAAVIKTGRMSGLDFPVRHTVAGRKWPPDGLRLKSKDLEKEQQNDEVHVFVPD
jgi:hypothetical protein